MEDRNYENLNASVNDPIFELIGNIVKCQKKNGKLFSARLIAVTASGELWFETATGAKTMDKRHSIESIAPYKPYSPEVSL